MLERQDAQTYRLQSRQWWDRAEALASGEEQDVCLAIAEGYARLAQLVETRARPDVVILSSTDRN
jgi:hypothetical protein